MEEQLATIQFLSHEIGPRPSTSAAEARAAAYVNSRLRQAGMDVEVQTFRAVPTVTLPYALILLAAILTPVATYFLPPLGLVLSILALVAFVGENLSFPIVSALLPLGTSQNIIGSRPAAKEARQHLIVLAHLDTPRANWLFHPKMGGSFRYFFLLLLSALALLPLLVVLEWVLDLTWLWYVQWIPAGVALAALLIFIHQEVLMPHVRGANNSASGIAVLLRLAEELAGLQHTTLWLVATGCKESGLHGARHFLGHYPFPRESTYVISVDHVGRGQPSIIAEQGILGTRRADPHLLEAATQAEAGDIAIDADPRAYHLLNTEAQVALMRGLRALSVMALEGGRPAHLFWPSDTSAIIQPEALERATRLLVGIGRRLDRQAAEHTET